MATRNTFFLGSLVLVLAAFAFGADVTGTWTATIETPLGVMDYTYELEANGDSLGGRAISQYGVVEISEGRIDGNEISFVENATYQDRDVHIEYDGTVVDDQILFTRRVGDFATEAFVATRTE